MTYLNGAFTSKEGSGLEKYKQVMETKFLVELDNCSQHNKL